MKTPYSNKQNIKLNTILGITVISESKSSILEKIIKYINQPVGFFHIVSLNPENLVVAQENKLFKRIIETAKIKIVDGIGVVLAGRLLSVKVGERLTGVDLVEELIKTASVRRLRVLMIGGKGNLALWLAKCYKEQFPEAEFFGLQGIESIKNPKKEEETKIFSIVTDYRPHLIFVAFGSPDQELWIERHKKGFTGCVVMGVGGSLDYLSKNIKRAPVFLQKIGLEWLYRLINQPWRWRRQIRLARFLFLVIKERISSI
jgi:N-acetylglucosaminyldiphosphoundecaprenol N-acetyl-beta-D-mannosaminyltransferase